LTKFSEELDVCSSFGGCLGVFIVDLVVSFPYLTPDSVTGDVHQAYMLAGDGMVDGDLPIKTQIFN